MLNNPVLEIFIGLVFIYRRYSLSAAIITEIIASAGGVLYVKKVPLVSTRQDVPEDGLHRIENHKKRCS